MLLLPHSLLWHGKLQGQNAKCCALLYMERVCSYMLCQLREFKVSYGCFSYVSPRLALAYDGCCVCVCVRVCVCAYV
jgi:hypothetical protein